MKTNLPVEGAVRSFTVVYDGTCVVCTRLVQTLARWDRRQLLEVVAFQEPGVMDRFPWIPPSAYGESLQVVGSDGTTWQGAAAIETLLTVLPRGPLIGWVFGIPFARPLADRFYRWFARNRYRWGCGKHCRVRPRASS